MDIRLGIIVDATKAVAGSKQARKAILGIGNAAKTAGSRILGAASAMFRLTTAATGLTAVGLAPMFIKTASSVEQMNLKMTVLLGSVEEGNRLFQDMSTYAGAVPFQLEDIMQSATTLSGIMKGGVDEINQWMPLIGDLAAVSGLGIQQTTEQIVRMYSAGAASADLFRERGILAMLGFEAGVSVSAEATRKQLMAAFEDPASRFRGASDLLASTWTGTLSMIGDKWFKFQKEFTERSGLFDYFKAIARVVDEGLGSAVENSKDKMEGWGQAIIGVFKRIVLFGARSMDLLRAPFGFVKSVLQTLWDGFKQLPTWVQDVGLVGAFVFGKKGVAVLAAMSLFMEKTKTTIEWFKAMRQDKVSVFEWLTTGHDKAEERLKSIESMTGKIIRKSTENPPVVETMLFGGPNEQGALRFFDEIDQKLKDIEADRARMAETFNGAGGGNGATEETATQRKAREEREKATAEAQDAAAADLLRLEEQYLSEEEMLRLSWERRNQIVMVARDNGIIDAVRAGEILKKNETKHEKDMYKLKTKMWKGQLTAAGTFFNSMMSLSQGQSKALFKVSKAGAIATGLIDSYAAFDAALKNPPGPPYTYPAAAAALAAGLAKVNAMRSTQFGSEGGAGGTGTGGGVIPQPIPSVPTQNESAIGGENTVTVQIVGDVYGWDDYIETKVIDGIKEAVTDRDVILVTGDSRNAREIASNG